MTVIISLKVINGHRFLYQSKARDVSVDKKEHLEVIRSRVRVSDIFGNLAHVSGITDWIFVKSLSQMYL